MTVATQRVNWPAVEKVNLLAVGRQKPRHRENLPAAVMQRLHHQASWPAVATQKLRLPVNSPAVVKQKLHRPGDRMYLDDSKKNHHPGGPM
jgi:hypothetical protein